MTALTRYTCITAFAFLAALSACNGPPNGSLNSAENCGGQCGPGTICQADGTCALAPAADLGDPCGGQCGSGTACVDHRCVPVTPPDMAVTDLCGGRCVGGTVCRDNGMGTFQCLPPVATDAGVQPDFAGGCFLPYAICNGACVDLTRDVNNCGKCGNVCPGGNTCVNGICNGPPCPNPVTLTTRTGLTVADGGTYDWKIQGAVGPVGATKFVVDGQVKNWVNGVWEDKVINGGQPASITWCPPSRNPNFVGTTVAAFNTQTVPSQKADWQLTSTGWDDVQHYCTQLIQLDSRNIYVGSIPENLGCTPLCSPKGYFNWFCQ